MRKSILPTSLCGQHGFRLIVSLIMMAITSPVNGLIGYDCGTNTLNMTKVSLLDVDKCNVETEGLKISKRHIQLLQLDHFSETKIWQCKIEIQQTIHHCGWMSHVSIVSNANRNYVMKVSRDTCHKAVTTGRLAISSTEIMDLQVNQSNSRSITFVGNMDSDGNCKGASYSDQYGTWTNVVVQGTAKITLSTYTTKIELSSNQVLLRSGYVCPLTSSNCIDGEGGYTFWEPLPETNECSGNVYSQLYKGTATKLERDGVTFYSIMADDISFVVAATGTAKSCGASLLKTEHPKLFINELTSLFSEYRASQLVQKNMNLLTNFNAEFVYVEKHTSEKMESLYENLIRHRCELERQILIKSLATAALKPNEFAFRIMKGPGYMAVTAGEAIHIVQCIPTEVGKIHLDKCYDNLPVTKDNEIMFLTPRTHILMNRTAEIPCDAPLSRGNEMHNTWYDVTPRPIEALAPTNLEPSSSPEWKYISPTNLATSGIYSQENLNRMRERIVRPRIPKDDQY